MGVPMEPQKNPRMGKPRSPLRLYLGRGQGMRSRPWKMWNWLPHPAEVCVGGDLPSFYPKDYMVEQ